MTPKLSIITVVFNNREGLCRTLESVKCQTFRDFEQIVIDGGSTDGTLEEIKKYESQIANFRWISEKDKGIYNAMNKGIKMAKGEYCYFLNSDDYIAMPNTLEKIFEKAKDADIIYGNLAIRKGEKIKSVIKYPKEVSYYTFFIGKRVMHHQASYIKRDLFEKYGYYRDEIKYVADNLFFFETVILRNVSCQYINRVFSIFLSGGVSSVVYSEEDQKAIGNTYKSAIPDLVWKDYEHWKEKNETFISNVKEKLLKKLYLIKALKNEEI